MKKIRLLLVCVTVILLSFGVAACGNFGGGPTPTPSSAISETGNPSQQPTEEPTVEITSSGLVLSLLADDTYEVSGINGDIETEIVIPGTYKGKPVTLIGNHAFYNCRSLTSIVIPDSVKGIGSDAFRNCRSLTSVVIPDSVEWIESSAFLNCYSLVHVVIGAGVTNIGPYAFSSCDSLIEVKNLSALNITAGSWDYGDVGSSAKRVYTEGESYLSTDQNGYTVYDDGTDKILVGHVGEEAHLTLPDGITEIYQYAFFDCLNLTSVVIPASVTEIGESAFDQCNKLIEVKNLSALDISAGSSDYGAVGSSAKRVYTEGESYLSTDQNGYTVYDDGTDKIVVAYAGMATDLTLPDGVTQINPYAFYRCDGLKSIVIPGSVTEIGESAFSECNGLTSVVIPDGVTEIGESAFYGCGELTSVVIGNSVTDISFWAFRECFKLIEVKNLSALDITAGSSDYGYVGNYAKRVYTEGESYVSTDQNGYIVYDDGTDRILVGYVGEETDLTLPGGITEIYQYAFYQRDGIHSVVIPDGVTSIGYNAFSGCDEMTGVVIGNSVTSIGERAFLGCSALTSVIIPDSVTSFIGFGTFSGCSGLTSVVIGNGMTDTGSWTFSGCSALTSVVIPGSVTRIGTGAFSGCSALTSIVLSDGVTQIDNNAFENCSALTSIVIPGSVTRIGTGAFYGCSALTSIVLPDSVTSISIIAFANTAYFNDANNWEDDVLYIGKHLIKAKVSVSGDYTVKGGTLTIANSAFENCSGLTSVVIPEGVTKIDNKTFFQCVQLKSVTIPGSVTSIGSDAFNTCLRLTNVVIPDGVTSIGYGAFADCSGLTSVVIGTGVTEIGRHAFSNCNKLIEVKNLSALDISAGSSDYGAVGSSAKRVYTEGESYLSTDQNGYTVYDDGTDKIVVAYAGTATDLTLPDGVTQIYQYAFSSRLNLTSVVIPGGVTEIGDYAFRQCNRLIEVKNLSALPITAGSLDYGNVGYSAKRVYTEGESYVSTDQNGYIVYDDGTDKILVGYVGEETDLTLPGGITEIYQQAFCQRDELTSVIISDGVTRIGYGAFEYCSALASVVIPGSVTEIGGFAFLYCEKLIEVKNRSALDIAAGNTDYGYVGYYAKRVYSEGESFVSTDQNGYTVYDDGTDKILVGYVGKEAHLTLPDGITQIYRHAFFRQSSLRSVVIPESVTGIGESVFLYCFNLTTITYRGTRAQWKAIDNVSSLEYTIPSGCVISCTDGELSVRD